MSAISGLLIHLHDSSRLVEQQRCRQTHVLPVHEQVAVDDRVAQAHFRSRHNHRQRGIGSRCSLICVRLAGASSATARDETPALASVALPRASASRAPRAPVDSVDQNRRTAPPTERSAGERGCPLQILKRKSGAGKGSKSHVAALPAEIAGADAQPAARGADSTANGCARSEPLSDSDARVQGDISDDLVRPRWPRDR